MMSTPEQVAQFLQSHPEFFEEYADLLARIYIPHPHGGRAIPIAERQILTLRDKNKLLETRLAELVRFGDENDKISEKLHQLTLALVGAENLSNLINTLYFNLREQFAVPHVGLRLWGERTAGLELPETALVSADLHAFTDSLSTPYCGPYVTPEIIAWFGEHGPHLKSFAQISLQTAGLKGLLVMASEDPKRFFPEMGTLYLVRLGEVLAATLGAKL